MRSTLLFCTFLAIVATWPFAVDPAGALLGHPGNDVWNHVWGYWWVAEELGHGRLPLSTNLMHYPETGRLFFIDTFGAVLTLPLQWLGGPVLAYNSAVFLSFWTAGFCAWALARHVVATFEGPGPQADRNAWIAAVAYTFAPHLLAQAYNGITETLNAAGLPLAVLAMIRLYERPSLVRGLQASLAVGVAMIANWYYGLFAGIGAGLYLLSLALWRRERIHWLGLPLPLLVTGIGSALLVGPVLLGFTSSLEGAGAVVSRDRAFVWKQLVTHNVTDFITFFHPGKFYSPDLKALHGEDLLIVVYLGWALMGLAALGVWRLRRLRDGMPWLIWVGVYGLLALGPYLFVNGQNFTVDGKKIPLPFLAFFDALPMFERISHPFRFVMGVQMGLAVLAALGLSLLPVWGRVVATLLVGLEFLLVSPAVWPLPRSSAVIPAVYDEIAADPVEGALLDLPMSVPNLERAVYLYWQTKHGRPGPYALNEPLPEILGRSHLMRALLVAEGGRMDRLPPMIGDLDLVVSGRSLERLGFRYVVVHGEMYPPEKLEQSLELLRAGLGPESRVDGLSYVWQLEPPHATGEEKEP